MPGLLYNRSCYTLLSSTITIDELVSFAVDNGYDSIALTDKNVLFGAMEFYHKCKTNNIKPVYGLEVPVETEEGMFNYLIYAKNIPGYQELIEVSTQLNSISDDFFSFEKLLELKNVIIIEDALNGYLCHASESKKNELSQIYYDKNIFVGLPGNDSEFNKHFNKEITQNINNKIKLVALPKALYASKDDFDSYKLLMCIQQSKNINDPTLKYEVGNSYLYTKSELESYFDAELLDNTDLIIRECNVDMSEMPKASLPLFPVPEYTDRKTYLTALCNAGLKKRFQDKSIPESYYKRLKYELDVICSMNFENYFLIVWDIILFARKNNINVGVGRGSAAGSLVAYCLGITHIDPIKYDLLFERFLNPERITMPDIDIDFPDNRRQEVIEYVQNKYGVENVAHIIAFGTLGARQVLKDVGKALQINSSQVDILTKAVGNNPNTTLKSAWNDNERFRTAVKATTDNSKLFNYALKLEGLPRHITTHAAGIVLSEEPLTLNMPLILNGADIFSTQYVMSYLEELGLIKFDFLALRNLTIIAEISDNINQYEQFDILKISLEDQKTYDMLSNGDTVGVFQLESEGMKNLLRNLKPRIFEDLSVAIALYRPGPMQNIPAYLAARNDPNNIHYIHHDLKPILEKTYGIIIYQEQIMQIAQQIAGFSLAKADILRKAISKKNEQTMLDMKKEFIDGALNNGYSREIAEQIYSNIEKFASYGFNKSHSIAYAMVAYQMAYLKTNYPLEFYLSLLNNVIGSEAKTNEYLVEFRKIGGSILPPSVNYSDLEYIIEDKALRYPLTGIKGIGRINAQTVIDEKNENGLFKDYIDFIIRMNSKGMNRASIETMIKAGCLDEFNYTRNTMLNNIDEVIRYGELIKIEKDGLITFDTSLVSPPYITQYPDSKAVKEKEEYALLGVYLREHPVEMLRKDYPQTVPVNAARRMKGNVTILLKIQRIKEHRTKTGELMCFIDGYDEYDVVNLVVMPNVYSVYSGMLEKDKIILASGKFNETGSMRVNTITVL